MQEEVENRTLTLVVSGTKFTGRLLKAAISKYMAHCKEKKLQKQRSRDAPVTPHGKQTVKQLIGQNQGISNIEITDPSIKEFEKKWPHEPPGRQKSHCSGYSPHSKSAKTFHRLERHIHPSAPSEHSSRQRHS